MTATQCPPTDRLRDFLGGRLSEEDSVALESHLSNCGFCEETANSMDAEPDTFAEYLVGSEAEAVNPSLAGALDLVAPLVRTEKSSSTIQVTGSVGSYDLLERLGRGGMGAVYLARHRELDRHVAIKLLPSLTARKEEVVARFRREMKAAGRLDHPAIVRATDAGELEGTHFLVMEVVDGTDLSQLTSQLTTGSQLSVENACEIVRQAAVGLGYAHRQGIVHRDVKPSNLMLDRSGRVKILDFGLAQLYQDDGSSDELTSIGQLMGTLEYMAPEQGARGASVDVRADVYSLGATLFRLLTGKSPLDCEGELSPIEKLRVLSEHRRRDIEDYRSDMPRDLVVLIEKMLASEPECRPEDCDKVVQALEGFCHGAQLERLHGVSAAKVVHVPADREQRPGVAESKAKGFATHVAAWVAGGAAFLMLMGGIWVALEYSKGQLVIDTDAEVTLRIVDEKQRVKELHVHSGAETTRLRDGKYEITIAEPSDGFSISENVVTIHRGETIVARVLKREGVPNTRGLDSALQRFDREVGSLPANGAMSRSPVGPADAAEMPSDGAGYPAVDAAFPAPSKVFGNEPHERSALDPALADDPFSNGPEVAFYDSHQDQFADPRQDPFADPRQDPFGDRREDPFQGGDTFEELPRNGGFQPQAGDPFAPSNPRSAKRNGRTDASVPRLDGELSPPPQNANPFADSEGATSKRPIQAFDQDADFAPATERGPMNIPADLQGVPRDSTPEDSLSRRIETAEQDQTNQIYETLKQRYEADWTSVPLSQIAALISDEFNVPVWINERTLGAAGLSSDLPLDLSMPKLALSNALRLAFTPHELAYIVRNEVLEITTAEDVRDFLVNPGDTLVVVEPSSRTGIPVYQVDKQPPVRGEIFRVDESGLIVLPHVGEVAIGGRSLGEIRYLMRAKYSRLYADPGLYAGVEVSVLMRRGEKKEVVRLDDAGVARLSPGFLHADVREKVGEALPMVDLREPGAVVDAELVLPEPSVEAEVGDSLELPRQATDEPEQDEGEDSKRSQEPDLPEPSVESRQ